MPDQIPEHLRDFNDVGTTRKWLADNTLDALKSRFPIEDNEFKLELHNPHFSGPQEYGLEKQKQALIKDEQLRLPIKGTWRLIHKPTGQVLDEREDTVMHLPYLTDRGTIINRGNEYNYISQARLKAGVYARHKKSGEIEAYYNVKPGTGHNFRVWLEPETGVFKVNVAQSNVPLYPLLQAMGVRDQEMAKAWSPEVLAANMKARSGQAIQKMYQRFVHTKPGEEATTEAEQKKALAEALGKAELDPWVTARTLGLKNAGNITSEVLMRSTGKLLGISRGHEKADDRDEPMFSSVMSIEDHIPERIAQDAGKTARTLLWKARRDRSLKRVGVGALNTYTDGYLLGSRLTFPLEETNPMSLLEQHARITRMGQGGIGDPDAITMSAHDVKAGQLGFIDALAGPEGELIGVDVSAAHRTFKGRDKQMYGEFLDPRTGRMRFLRPEDTDGKVLAFPGEMASKEPMANVMKNGKVTQVPKSEVDLEVPSFSHMFSPNTNLNPMPTAVQPARQFYGSKFWSQYMPQKNGEVPLVDSLMPDGKATFSEHYGRKMGCLTAEAPCIVTKVEPGKIEYKTQDGELHTKDVVQHLPFNRLTSISYTPTVKVGDVLQPGDMLAHSNFTDAKTGSLRMGRNLSVAVIPMRGKSYEDGRIISESAAKKLTTERMYGFDQEASHDIELGTQKYSSLFPSAFKEEQLKTLDEHGIVKPGTILHKGDPIILAVGPKLLTSEDIHLGRLHKALRDAHTDKATIWEHDYDGVVTDSARTRGGAKVNVSAYAPVQVGDKLSDRSGLKGVVSEIIPDDQMPRNAATNEPFDVALNPMGILSRVAANALIEMQLGKLAKKTGKQVRIPQLPPEEGWTQWATNELKKNDLQDKEQVFDPELGRALTSPVATGNMYVMAFHHLAEKKLSERGSSGSSYSADELPSRGGGESQQAKRMSNQDITALLAHGAHEVLKDTSVIRGAKNDDYWKALKLGRPLPEPEVPFVYKKFLNLLKAGGINISQKGDTLKLLPMTDKDVGTLSSGTVTSSAMLDDDMQPIKGGLFDPSLTGGANGKNWTHVELNDPLPNPVFAEPVRRLLGLRKQDMLDVIAGRRELGGKTGGTAIRDALAKIDIDTEINKQRDDITKLRGAQRDNAVKCLGYLVAAKKAALHPSEWVVNKVPVLPPVFRPLSRLGDITIQADLNELYRDLVETNNGLGNLRHNLPDSALQHERENLYHAFEAVTGLGESITPEGQSKHLSGALRTVIGHNAKHGYFQSRVMSKPVDVVGRTVATGDPSLDMDSIGIPEESAWNLYKPFVLRSLVRQNYPVHKALKMIEERDKVAGAVLHEEMQSRPVIVDRAPTWHKFNLLAFHPHVVKGDVIRASPLISKGFNLDFDGDCVIGKILVATISGSCYSGSGSKKRSSSMSQINTVVVHQIIDLAEFPRIEESAITKPSGVTVFRVPDGVFVPAYGEHGIDLYRATEYSVHPNCEEHIVTTHFGRTLVCSEKHSLATLDPDTLQVAPTSPVDALLRAVPTLRGYSGGALTELKGYVPKAAKSAAMPESVALTYDLGWFVGASVGDGWFSSKACPENCHGVRKDESESEAAALCLAYRDAGTAVADRWVAVARTLGYDGKPTVASSSHEFDGSQCLSHKVTVGHTALAHFVHPLIGHGAHDKHLPENFAQMPLVFRRGLLAGLLDTDGTLCWTNAKPGAKRAPQFQCAYTTVSPRLAAELQVLALSLGMRAHDSTYEHNGSTVHLLTLGTFALQHADWLALTHPSKVEALQQLRSKPCGKRMYDIVPVTPRAKEEVVRLLTSLGATRRKNRDKDMFALYAHVMRSAGFMSRDQFEALTQVVSTSACSPSDYLARWLAVCGNASVSWDIVECVQATGERKTMYDLTVPDAWTFCMEDGLVVWDSMNYHVPVSDKARDEALAKMLPSKNLFSLTDLKSPRHTPQQEMALGLYLLTRKPTAKPPVRFATVAEAKRAYRDGRIGPNDPVEIGA